VACVALTQTTAKRFFCPELTLVVGLHF
jgi:hypothetical protein